MFLTWLLLAVCALGGCPFNAWEGYPNLKEATQEQRDETPQEESENLPQEESDADQDHPLGGGAWLAMPCCCFGNPLCHRLAEVSSDLPTFWYSSTTPLYLLYSHLKLDCLLVG